jgi:hypothetical protein
MAGVPTGARDDEVVPPSRFLSEARREVIGRLNVDLLLDLSWLHRRRETIELLSDAMLRRRVSIDYTLPGKYRGFTDWPGLLREGHGRGSLHGVPLVVLQKLPADMMNFDLQEESGRSIPLMSREDNAWVSAATLEQMARVLMPGLTRGKNDPNGHPYPSDLPPEVAQQLRDIALAKTRDVDVHLERFSHPLADDAYPGLREELMRHDDFGWWLRSLAVSSIVMAFLPAADDRRRILKFSYDEPINPVKRRRMAAVRFGFASWDLWVQNEFIGAGNYHLESVTPPGMRARQAHLLDIEEQNPIADSATFVRRLHLYARDARHRRRALGWISLRPNWYGLLLISALISGFVVTGLVILWRSTGKVALNPSGAPALLLLLPGVVATVVGRPDSHAVTARVLSSVRHLLLLSGFTAYVAAAKVALTPKAEAKPEHTETMQDLEHWLRWPTYVAIGCCVFIVIAVLLNVPLLHAARERVREWAKRRWFRPLWTMLREPSADLRVRLQRSPGDALTHAVDAKPSLVKVKGTEIKREYEAGLVTVEAEGVERIEQAEGDTAPQAEGVIPRDPRAVEAAVAEAGPLNSVTVTRTARLLGQPMWNMAVVVTANPITEGAELVCGVAYVARRVPRVAVPIALWRRKRNLRRCLHELAAWRGLVGDPAFHLRQRAQLEPNSLLGHVVERKPFLMKRKDHDRVAVRNGTLELRRTVRLFGRTMWKIHFRVAATAGSRGGTDVDCDVGYAPARFTAWLVPMAMRLRRRRLKRRLKRLGRKRASPNT